MEALQPQMNTDNGMQGRKRERERGRFSLSHFHPCSLSLLVRVYPSPSFFKDAPACVFPPPPRPPPRLGPPRASPRQRALAELRGIDFRPLERVGERAARPAAAFMPQILSKLRMDKRQGEAEIARVWRHLIDPVLTAHAQPVGLNKGTLFVNVDSSVWLDEIV